MQAPKPAAFGGKGGKGAAGAAAAAAQPGAIVPHHGPHAEPARVGGAFANAPAAPRGERPPPPPPAGRPPVPEVIEPEGAPQDQPRHAALPGAGAALPEAVATKLLRYLRAKGRIGSSYDDDTFEEYENDRQRHHAAQRDAPGRGDAASESGLSSWQQEDAGHVSGAEVSTEGGGDGGESVSGRSTNTYSSNNDWNAPERFPGPGGS